VAVHRLLNRCERGQVSGSTRAGSASNKVLLSCSSAVLQHHGTPVIGLEFSSTAASGAPQRFLSGGEFFAPLEAPQRRTHPEQQLAQLFGEPW